MTYEYMVSWVDVKGARHTIGVNELDLSLFIYFGLLRAGLDVDIVSGITGEVFIYHNESDTYIADDWDIIILDYLMRESWG